MQARDNAPLARPTISGGRRGTPPEQRARRAPPRALWRRNAIVGVKLVHSAIFLVNSAAILHVFVAGIRDRPSRWTGAALAVALTESAVFVANRGRCPLTQVTEGLGAESGRVLDIFLPRWFADRIPQFCTPPLLIGVLALVVNAWRHAERRQVSDQRPGSRTRRAIVTRPVRARMTFRHDAARQGAHTGVWRARRGSGPDRRTAGLMRQGGCEFPAHRAS